MYGINPRDSNKAECLVESHHGVVDEDVGVDQRVSKEETSVATYLGNHAGGNQSIVKSVVFSKVF